MIFEILNIFIRSIFTLFIPGFVLSWALFPERYKIDYLERIVMSFGLSLGVVYLIVFYLNFLFGIKINFQNTMLIIIAITIIGCISYIVRLEKSVKI